VDGVWGWGENVSWMVVAVRNEYFTRLRFGLWIWYDMISMYIYFWISSFLFEVG
jgi:hypothetical protein